MEAGRLKRREAYMNKQRTELANLQEKGLIMAGNAMSSVVFLKGKLTQQDLGAEGLLSGADGVALHKSLGALGYEPQDWQALATTTLSGQPLAAFDLRLGVSTLSPSTVIICDEQAASVFRNAYAQELAAITDLNEAMLKEGVVAHILGMRVLNLGGFEDSLRDKSQKQVMWARLKQVPAQGEPF